MKLAGELGANSDDEEGPAEQPSPANNDTNLQEVDEGDDGLVQIRPLKCKVMTKDGNQFRTRYAQFENNSITLLRKDHGEG